MTSATQPTQRNRGVGSLGLDSVESRIYQEQSEALFEQQNDQQVDILHVKVDQLKELTRELQSHLRQDKHLLNNLDDDFDSTGTYLGTTLSKLNTMLTTATSKHMCYLVLFIFVAFLFVYYTMRKSAATI